MFTLIECFYLFLSLSLLGGAGASPISRHRQQTRDNERTGLKLKAQLKSLPFDLGSSLPSVNSSTADLPSLPQQCSAYMDGDKKECKTSMTATNVTFNDCGDAFTICYCQGANMTMETAVDRLGRVPVGLRRYVGTTVVLPTTDDTPNAYTLVNGDIHLFGDNKMDTWVHEAFHAYDYATGTPFSESKGWLQALVDDSCAPDTYSVTNQVEDFAQVSVVMVYNILHQQMPKGMNDTCMKKQMDYINTLPVFNVTTLFGNTCAIDPSTSTMGARHTLAPPNPPPDNRVLIPVPIPLADPAPDPNTDDSGPVANSSTKSSGSVSNLNPTLGLPLLMALLSASLLL